MFQLLAVVLKIYYELKWMKNFPLNHTLNLFVKKLVKNSMHLMTSSFKFEQLELLLNAFIETHFSYAPVYQLVSLWKVKQSD